jgi:hypothetical protein
MENQHSEQSNKSNLNEKRIVTKRAYTEQHPQRTVGMTAKIRNKMLEAIKDGKIGSEEFDKILKELSSNSKRWMKRNSKLFNISEDGVSLSSLGSRILKGITLNEATETNPEVWVPGEFDKEISKLPNDKITLDVIKKIAKKHKVFIDDAIKYVEYGWSLDLQENNNNKKQLMKNKLVSESFQEFVDSNNMNENSLNEAFKSSILRNLLTMQDASKFSGGFTKEHLPNAFYGLAKIQMDKIEDADLNEITPKEAYKTYTKDNDFVVFYIVDNEKENPYSEGIESLQPGLLGVTRGKEFLSIQFQNYSNRTRTLKNSDGHDAVGGNKRYKGGYGSSGIYNVKRASDLADRAYVFSLKEVKNSSKDIISKRNSQKFGATAFQNDKDFKAANLKRYKEILATKASKLPLDKMVNDAIDLLSTQIKDGLAKNEKGKYGQIIIGLNSKGRGAKMRDASNHMSNILDEYGRYVQYAQQREESKYYDREVKSSAKILKDEINKIKTFDYAW